MLPRRSAFDDYAAKCWFWPRPECKSPSSDWTSNWREYWGPSRRSRPIRRGTCPVSWCRWRRRETTTSRSTMKMTTPTTRCLRWPSMQKISADQMLESGPEEEWWKRRAFRSPDVRGWLRTRPRAWSALGYFHAFGLCSRLKWIIE